MTLPVAGTRKAVPAALAAILDEVVRALSDLYGERLAGAYLFGSHARGESVPGSDIDVLVVLRVIERHASEIARTSALRADVSVRAGTTVSFAFVTAADWSTADTPFLTTVREDAVPL